MYVCLSQVLITFIHNRFILIFILSSINGLKQSWKKNELIIFNVEENSPLGHIVGEVATPEFSPPFEIHSNNEKFIISKDHGLIKVAGDIDREKQSVYEFLIISANGDTRQIQIKIIDVNDNAPLFTSFNIEKSIPENHPIGSKIDLTIVSDPDEGKNSVQSVKITSGDSENIFAIDYHERTQGEYYIRLILKQTLDFESISQFNLVIQAIDGGAPPLQSTLLVKINVQNANDNIPKFDISRYIASVKENQEINKTFLRVRATDNDIGASGELFYFIDHNSQDSQFFAVNHRTGDIFLKRNLDFEQTKSHQITIGVKDNSDPYHTSKVPVIIDVIDINDNPPQIQVIWTEPVSQLTKDIESNSIVAHIKVTDADAISTSFDLQIVNKSPFLLNKILPKMWELKTNMDLSDIKSSDINFTLQATDYPKPSLHTIETFKIKLQQSYSSNVSFAKNVYTFEIKGPILYEDYHIVTLETIKVVPSKSYYYFAMDNNNNLFKINQTTGKLFSKSFIDCGYYAFNISLFSQKNKMVLDRAQIHITIKSGRKQPLQFENGFQKIFINSKINQCSPQIAVRNRHCGIKVRYKYDSLVTPSGPFYVNNVGAFCIDKNVHDYQLTTNRFLYRVSATDENNSSTFCLVLLIFQSSEIISVVTKDIKITLSLIENQNLSQPIARVAGTFYNFSPICYYDIIQYEIITDDNSADSVSVNRQSGDVFLKSYPKEKTPIKVSIKISTIDDVLTFSTSILTIDFKKLYFAHPFYQFYVNKSQKFIKSSVIGKVTVYEDSPNSEKVTYHLTSIQEYDSYFTIEKSTGHILSSNLNLFHKKVVSLSVYAINNDGVTCHAQVLIYLNENLREPVFDFPSLSVNIWENITVGNEIIQIIPKFPSETDIYQLVFSEHSEKFNVNYKSGQVFLQKSFDREKTSKTKITVKITNEKGSALMDIVLHILDVNDNRPQCENSIINLFLEDKESYGTEKCPFHCSDPDTFVNANLTYRMKMFSPSGLTNPFKLQQNTGCLMVVSSLDKWTINPDGKFNLLITVSDNGLDINLETDIQIYVTIVDTNNHSPMLISYNVFFVLENAVYGTEVGTLLMEDEDRDLNGEMDVSIKDSHHNQWYYVDKINRNKFVIRSKNLSAKTVSVGSQRVTLVVNDKGLQPRQTNVDVTIYVDGINKHSPKISSPSANESILFFCPLLPGSKLFTIKSTDLDEGLNGKTNYFIQEKPGDDNLFIADVWSGLVVTRKTLTCSHSPRVRLSVSDLGFPPKSSYLNINVKSFEKTIMKNEVVSRNFTFILSEDSQPGSVLGQLNYFPDFLGAKCLFSNNFSSSAENVLHIRYDSQQVLLLNNDLRINKKTYSVVATFHKALTHQNSVPLFINLIVNRLKSSWPVFSEDSPTVLSVKENLPTGTLIGQFSTKTAENIEVRYSINQPDLYFVINPRTGVLVTFKPFDRESESHDKFMIEVIASHISYSKRFSVLPVQVVISDENDNPPSIMSPTNLDIQVPSSVVVNENLIRIVARDEDIGQNSLLHYSISSTAENIFSIDQSSGEIRLISIPKKPVYELNVTVSDSGRIPNSVSVVYLIHFKAIKNKIKPKLLTQTLSMQLSLPQRKSGYVLGKVSQVELSSQNLDLRYHLMAGKFSQIFSIHPISGEIKTQKPVTIDDTGNSEIIQLSVILQSVQDPNIYDIGILIINIDYGNQNSPSFSRPFYKIKLPEDEAITDFMTIAANDPDLGMYGEIVYKLTGDVQDKKIFVDPLTGRLSCSALNYMEKKIYNLEIVAVDCKGESFGLSTTAKILIIVQNTKKHPLSFNATHFSLKIEENLPSGTTLGRINTIQSSMNAEVIYILNPGHSHIRINSSTGELSTNGPLHRQTVEFIDLTIHAFAKSSYTGIIQTTSAIVDIRIIDVNDNYPIPSENPVKIIIPNTDSPQKPLAKLSATDLDKNSKITYGFDMTDPKTQDLENLYSLDAVSGSVFLKSHVSNREKLRHFLRVIVSDNGLPNKSTVVLLDISLNHEQQYIQMLPEKPVFRVQENSVPGTFIGQLKLADGCVNEKVEYSIIDGINHKLIELHESSGRIFVARSGNIDREKIDTIILWTQVICLKSKQRGYKKVLIHVDDVDDNQPVFSQSSYVAFLNEGQPQKTSVIRITVYDPDVGINSQVDYFIEFHSTQEEFFIDSNGEVKTNVPLNYHTKSVYNLIIKASSKASPLNFAECKLTVYIININDQRPKISPSIQTLQIDTKRPVGSFIVKITAKDSDGPDGICYRMRHREFSAERLFLSVAYDSGEIFLSRKLLVSDIGKHELHIIADDGKFSSSALIFIDVIDDNNHMPTLRENTLTILLPESIAPGSNFYYLHADDKDQGENSRVTFEILTHTSIFGIRSHNNNTASLYLTDDSIQQKGPFFLAIQLTDNNPNPQKRLSSVSTLVVLSKSINSRPPVFIKNVSNSLMLSESTISGSRVSKLTCLDVDSEKSVLYRINSSNSDSNFFHIDMESGDLFLIRPLNYVFQWRFTIFISCEIAGEPERLTVMNISITVNQGNKSYLALENKTIEVSVETSEMAQLPLEIYNLDTINKKLLHMSYTLLSISPDDPENIKDPPQFEIDSFNIIWLKGGNLFQCRSWNIIIAVTDERSYQDFPFSRYRKDYIFVTVNVLAQAVTTIKYCVEVRKLTGIVNENEPPSTTVLELPSWYNDIKYNFTPHENFGLFCDKSPRPKCVIKTKTILDFENREQYGLQLMVTGSFSDRKSCNHVLMVEVFVLDADEYSPEFTQQSYRHTVEGGVPKLGQALYTIQATDKDKGRYGLVRYQILDNPSEHFGMKNDTGTIFIKSSFVEDNDVKMRSKRSTNKEEKPKYRKKVFQFRISASSGIKTSYALVELSMLVPGSYFPPTYGTRLTDLHIILLAILPVTIIVIILVIVLVCLLKKKYICIKSPSEKKESNCPSSRTDSPKTNSWNTQNSAPSSSYKKQTSVKGSESQRLPDVALYYHTQQYLSHSDTQDFNLSCEDVKHMTSSSLGTNDDPTIFSPYSETSSKHEENKVNINSGIGPSQKRCNCCEDSGIENRRMSKGGVGQKSNGSLTSSSTYSGISNSHSCVQQTLPCIISIQSPSLNYNQSLINNPVNKFRDAQLNYQISPNLRPSLGTRVTSRKKPYMNSAILKSNSDISEMIPLESRGQSYRPALSDIRNNNHMSSLPVPPEFLDEVEYSDEINFSEDLNCPSYPRSNYYQQMSGFSHMLMIQPPPLPSSAISSNINEPETVTQHYSDVTEI